MEFNYKTLKQVSDIYINEELVHTNIWYSFFINVNNTKYLREHRDYIERNRVGYGDRPFHWIWKLLVDEMPKDFKFLEIGVYKGQVISLIKLLSDITNKNADIYGVTPLDKSGDKYNIHPDEDYLNIISKLFYDFNLDITKINLIQGYSNNENVINTVNKFKEFDIVYIDGSHDYEVVISDLNNYSKMLKVGGYLVIDDSSLYLNMPFGKYKDFYFFGLEDVCKATDEFLKQNKNYKTLFVCGHNRIFKKYE